MDTVARIGGDEFTILVDDIQDVGEVIVVADRILNKFLSPVIIKSSKAIALNQTKTLFY
ncbi:MAG: diguanylate cyclase domain-containing protein [Pseudanabaena sp.]|nr:diguanylate cyclase [Pseudanabaena sp. M090S1SP2A07QC]MCA6506293.1 diguanylate cyclase [Pseudanabaena sp. M172S2SP2A07QC]MCA6519891.1 diguanylate cyclase [Pseudanabaena sp. M110S1SP2A07QC]MCA6522222.1 diguanylate cyclase [Pseudanabaena sp. M051S1SP2A07QC]MCA6528113.1 diguanylate cyclase [Pseudanabaena sp. M179S2SP2A07QC]MCA6531234.1 diguanylate cyclase [Pseudanabaena sp. M125S2SP2A07QC]MCA6536874.1 diguanylate cyclase [Pseudanabaena sp. M176S2SP2A07QC]MCA6540352.1 diguanylate cyclase [Pse